MKFLETHFFLKTLYTSPTLHRGAGKNLLQVKTTLLPEEANLETVFNQSKSVNYVLIEFSMK